MLNAREFRVVRSVGAAAVIIFSLLACSKTDLGFNTGGFGSGAKTTTISGKVALPAALANKPGYKAQMLAAMAHGKPGTPGFKPSSKPVAGEASTALPAQSATLVSAPVELYDASHPEWIYPIAVTQTDSSGNYTLSVLANAAQNGNSYKDGDPIPSGYYTLLSKKTDPVTNELRVALQVVVKAFSGAISGADLVAEPSDADPDISFIQGVRKNSDGTETWGKKTDTTPGDPQIAANSAVQVEFSMAMDRQSVISGGISVACASGNVDGKWTISADWTTATFYPANPLPAGDCTVTVSGSDTSATPVRNVYENARTTTAYGYFTATSTTDTVKPTGIILSPDATNADVISPIRFASNELLDVNDTIFASNPSLGDRPRIVYAGKAKNSTSQYKYIYDVIPSQAMNLNTDYDVVISGAKDLSGNEMSTLNYSFGTADSAQGVTSTASDVQGVQLEALTTFGKWVRAMNEHNIGSIQSLMSGDFIFEYDSQQNGVNSNDANRDGRLSLGEFSKMLEQSFTQWEYCGTTMSGAVVGSINVDMVNNEADFAFTLSAASTLTQPQCRDAAPDQKLYLTLKQQNSAWVIVRASQGIDTRAKPLVIYDYIPLLSPKDGTVLTSPTSITNPVQFSWDDSISVVDGQPAKSTNSYVFVIWDSRNQWNGAAYVIDPSILKTTDGLNIIYQLNHPFDSSAVSGIKNISPLFGFSSTYGWMDSSYLDSYWNSVLTGPGEDLEWSVLGLGTIKETDDFSKIDGPTLLRDIVASSRVSGYQNEGVRPHITSTVLSNGVPLTFSEAIWGYDAGSKGTVTLQLASTNANPTWDIWVYGNGGSQEYTSTSNPAIVNGTVDINLYKGVSYVSISDGQGLYDWFSVATIGGIQPVVSIYTVMTDNGLSLAPDAWGYVSAVGAAKVTIMGTVSDSSTSVTLNLSNSRLGANDFRTIPVNNNFFMTDIYLDPATNKDVTNQLNIYKGDNWISISSQTGYNSIDIYTDTGSTYVPPITVSIPNAVLSEDDGNTTIWDASASGSRVVISGTMSNPAAASTSHNYSLYSDAGYQSGYLYTDAKGKYYLPADLYHGWNYLYMNDGGTGWAYVKIYTSNGKVVVPLQVTSVDGVAPAYQGAQMTVSGCSTVVKGIADPGSWLNVYWGGSDGVNYYSETPFLQAGSTPTIDTNGDGIPDAAEFTLTVPVLSGSGAYNYLDIYNSMWRWAGVSLTTTATSCSYVSPVNTVTQTDGVTSGGATVTPSNNYGTLTFPGDDVTRLIVSGTHTRADQTISATLSDQCGVPHPQIATAAQDGTWSFSNIPLYKGGNSFYISDGFSSSYYYTNSATSTLQPQPVVSVALAGLSPTTADCSYSTWDAGGATSVTITATLSDGLSGDGFLYANQKSIPLTFVNGIATVTVNVYQGDNYYTVYDPMYRMAGMDITSANNVPLPKAMAFTNPVQGASVGTGAVTVTGQWDTTVYTPDYLYASVAECDANWNCAYQYFSNDGTSTAFNSIDTSTGNFSFTANFGSIPNATYTQLSVYGYSYATSEGHQDTIYVNNNPNNYQEYYYKPTAGGAATNVMTSPLKKAVEQDRIKQMLQRMKAAQVKALAKPKH